MSPDFFPYGRSKWQNIHLPFSRLTVHETRFVCFLEVKRYINSNNNVQWLSEQLVQAWKCGLLLMIRIALGFNKNVRDLATTRVVSGRNKKKPLTFTLTSGYSHKIVSDCVFIQRFIILLSLLSIFFYFFFDGYWVIAWRRRPLSRGVPAGQLKISFAEP